MNKENIIAVFVLIIFLIGMVFFVAVERDNARVQYKDANSKQEEYRKLLIDFGHARYVIDPVTGISKFEIDPSPNKTSK